MILLCLLSCAPPAPGWTEPGALGPHHARLDTDGDGRLGKAEWDARSWNGPRHWSADGDGDGDVSPAELLVLVRAQPAAGVDGGGTPDARTGATGAARPAGGARDVWEVLVWMSDALRANGDEGLDPAVVAAAVESGRIDSDAARAALATLRPRWEAHGWAWPEGLPR